MDFSSLQELFKARRSIRQWTSEPVPEELLLKAVEAATWAPNSGGKQPYHCYIITNSEKIKVIGQAVQEVSNYLASLSSDETERKTAQQWQANSSFFAKAPALIAVTATIYQSLADKLQVDNMNDPRVADINKGRQSAGSRLQTVGGFVDHLLLAFHTLGLGAVWMTGPTQAKTAIEKIIGTKENEDFVTLVPVGYPAEQPEPHAHKPLAEMVTVIR
jgi:nitroreductase